MSAAPAIHIGLVGQSLSLSLSPALHETEGKHLGFDYHYEVFDTEREPHYADLSAVLAEMRSRGFTGTNITHPFKQEVMAHLDAIDPVAQTIGAVNTVVFTPEGLVGYNTDWLGFLRSLEHNVPHDLTARVTQIGAGGAGAAVSYALLHYGVEHLCVLDADAHRATDLVALLGPQFPHAVCEAVPISALAETVENSVGVVNATPLGMAHHPGLPLPENLITPARWFHDVVYMPLETALVIAARQAGARVVGGGDMAVFQAAEGIRLFTGVTPDTLRMREHFLALVASGAQESLARKKP